MKTRLWAIGLIILCTVLTSSAQIFYKIGTNKLNFNLISVLTNWPIILGLFLYALGAILVIVALRGGEVTVLYPIITSSYIWVSLGSRYFFNEVITWSRWAGIFSIIIGIVFIVFDNKGV